MKCEVAGSNPPNWSLEIPRACGIGGIRDIGDVEGRDGREGIDGVEGEAL